MPKRKITIDKKTTHALATRVGDLRRERGLSQAELADVIDIEPATMSRLETGKRPVSGPLLFKVARALGVPVSELLGEQADAADRRERELLAAWRSLQPDVAAAVLVLVRELARRRAPRAR